MDVGIRELKAKLSEYLARAEKGELIRVTDRGRPRALLVPLRDSRVQERIRQGVAEGWIKPPRRRGPRPRVKPAKADRSIQEMMDEDRGA